MFDYETLWDIYEMKFVIFFLSACLAIWLTKYIYDHSKKEKKDETSSDSITDKT
jgi:hypothetical protein